MGKQRIIDRAIEPAEWRVTSAEQTSGYNQAASIEVWGGILRFVMEWQNTYEGQSPTMFEIARNLGISGKSVRYHCGQMMLRGLIKYGPMGIQILGAGNALVSKPAEAQGPSETTKEARVRETKKPSKGNRPYGTALVERARAIARFINEYRSRYGVSPQFVEIAKGLGYVNHSPVSITVRKMVDLGWIDHEKNHSADATVTSLGMAVLFGEGLKVSAQPDYTPQFDQQVEVDMEKMDKEAEAARTHYEENADKPIGTTMAMAVQPEPVHISMPWLDPKAVAEAMSRPAAITRISAEPDPHLSQVSDADLILELLDRGFMVTRQKR